MAGPFDSKKIFNIGCGLLLSGDAVRAADAFRRLTNRDPDEATAWNFLARSRAHSLVAIKIQS